VAEGVAGDVHAMADLENALGAVVRPVVAVFGFHHMGHQTGRGTISTNESNAARKATKIHEGPKN